VSAVQPIPTVAIRIVHAVDGAADVIRVIKRVPWAPRRLALAGLACLAVSVAAGLIDYAIYQSPGATQICTEFGEDCARTYTYFGFQAVQGLAGLFGLVSLLVAAVRTIRSGTV
jgi:hypothetical protein